MYDINATHNIFITIVNAPDSDLFIIFLKNPFFILLLLVYCSIVYNYSNNYII